MIPVTNRGWVNVTVREQKIRQNLERHCQLQQATGQVRVGKLDVQLAHLFEQMVTQTGVDQLRQQILGELEWHQVIFSRIFTKGIMFSDWQLEVMFDYMCAQLQIS